MTAQDYVEAQARMSDLEVGDWVKVLRMPTDYEMGWVPGINEEMPEMVGREYEIIAGSRNGYQLSNSPVHSMGCWWLPFFVLERVGNRKNEEKERLAKLPFGGEE